MAVVDSPRRLPRELSRSVKSPYLASRQLSYAQRAQVANQRELHYRDVSKSRMSSNLAQTPLHSWHAAHGGRLVDFAGWSMPVQYTSIVAEHNATRTAAGLFDISHMGRLMFSGPGTAAFLDSLVTRRVIDLMPGQIRYGLVTNETGGILDDVLVYRLQTAATASHLMVVNASNREKIVAWINAHLQDADGVELRDTTHESAMLAIQGPRAIEILQPLADAPLAKLKYYTGQEARHRRRPSALSAAPVTPAKMVAS